MSNITTTATPHQSIGRRVIRALLIIASALLIIASAGLGTYFGFESGSQKSFWIGVAFAIAALGGEILKPFAVDAAFKAFARFRLGWGVICSVTAIVCVLYSLAGELALSAGSRSDLVAKRDSQATAAANDKSNRARAQAELAELAKSKQRTRSVDELEAIIARTPVQQPKQVKASNRAGCAAENGTGRWVCPGAQVQAQQVHPLAAELARAKRKASLEAIVLAAPSKASGVGHADPLATALSQYLATAGYSIDLDVLSKWLYLVPVIFIETGSAFGVVVYRVFATEGEQRQKRDRVTLFSIFRRRKPAPATVADLPATFSKPTFSRPVLLENVAGKRSGSVAAMGGLGDGRHVIAALQSAGRPLSNGELANAMGVSDGEASKRRGQVRHMLRERMEGRHVMVSLAGQVH